MRLVADNDEPDLTSVPAMLRQYAKDIEAGQHGDINTVILILESGDVLELGEEMSDIELMGLFEAAKLQTFANMVIEDE